MISTTLRVPEETHRLLKAMAQESGEPMTKVLAKALETYRRQRFWDQVNAGYAAIWANPKSAAALKEERAAWEATLSDGLGEDDASA